MRAAALQRLTLKTWRSLLPTNWLWILPDLADRAGSRTVLTCLTGEAIATLFLWDVSTALPLPVRVLLAALPGAVLWYAVAIAAERAAWRRGPSRHRKP